MSAALYELTGDYKRLMDACVDWETGEVDEGRVPEFKLILTELQDALEGKIDGCARALRMMSADIKSLKEEEDRLYKRRQSIERSKEHLRGYITDCLTQAGLPKVKTTMFTVYTRDGEDSVEIVDESVIPMGCRKVPGPPPPDKALIKDLLAQGKDVPGAKLVKGRPVLVVR